MSGAVIVQELKKSYGSQKVLKGVSFTVKKGEIFALLGTNGAGKTTTLECLEGLLSYESGTIQRNGTLGVQLQSSSLPKNMKVSEAVRFFANWKHTKENQETIRRLGVEPFWNKQYSQLSTGQKRRLHLVLALLGTPDIIILDEPTAGLDVEGRAGIHEEIKNLKAKGKTILLASHDLTEVEELCEHIAILNRGEIAFEGTPSELMNPKEGFSMLRVWFSGTPDVSRLKSFCEWEKEQKYFIFRTQQVEETLEGILNCVKEQELSILDIRMEQEGMEQRFLQIAREGME